MARPSIASGSWSTCGVTFPGPDLPGVDLVLPDIRFLAKERKNLKAIFITHAHEDHYGALADLWPGLNVPVYASPSRQACWKPSGATRSRRSSRSRSRRSRLALSSTSARSASKAWPSTTPFPSRCR
jgi:glyoxylase-like metal-dependent hydrolase (beta-lactamase superfamily II)